MRRTVAALTIATATSAVLLAAPAAAAAGGPADYCRSVYQSLTNPVTGITFQQYVIPVEFSFGGRRVVQPFGVSSFQGCVSTVASGMTDGVVPAAAITKPAFLAQCEFLEASGFVSYPHTFYGRYPAENRPECARILEGVATGQLSLPGPPPVG